MQEISSLLVRPIRQATPIRSERDEQIQKFLDRLNPPREKAGYKPYTAKVLVGKIGRVQKTDSASLYRLYQECEGADNFSKLFHWKLKGVDKPQNH